MDCKLKKNWGNDSCKKAVGEAHFTIILPKADNSGNKISPSSFVKHISKINDRFGGSTTKPITLGCWRDEKRNKLQCEAGLAVESWRDFDSDEKMSRLNSYERKRQLEKDFDFMNRVAKDSANEFGQDSVPVIFDNITDAKLNKGRWKQRIDDSKLTGKKVSDDLFNDLV